MVDNDTCQQDGQWNGDIARSRSDYKHELERLIRGVRSNRRGWAYVNAVIRDGYLRALFLRVYPGSL